MARTTTARTRVMGQVAAFCLLLTTLTGVALGTSVQPAAAQPSCASAGITVTPLHGDDFFTDYSPSPPTNPQLRGKYIGYRFTNNTGATLSNHWVGIGNFRDATNGPSVLGLAPGNGDAGSGESGIDQLATSIANGASDNSYFYLAAPTDTTGTTVDQLHTVTIYNGPPSLGGTAVCTYTYAFDRVESVIQANANKVDVVVATSNPPGIGAIMTMTVTGETGTIGSGPAYAPLLFQMSPAAFLDWPPGVFKLEAAQVSIDLTTGGGTTPTTYNHFLTYNTAAGATSNRAYTIVYTFRITGLTSQPTKVSPIQDIASGTQIKHTAVGNYNSSGCASGTATICPITQPTNTNLSVSKSASPTVRPGGGTVTYTVTLRNTSTTQAATFDQVVDTLPSGVSYNAGTATYNGSPIGNPNISGQTLTFVGPFAVPVAPSAGTPATRTLTYQATVSSTPNTYTNSVVGRIGSVTIGNAVGSSTPATSTVTVPAPPVAVNNSYSTPANTTLNVSAPGVLGNDSGTSITVTSNTNPASGTLTQNANGSLSYVPATGFSGVVTYNYTITDTYGQTATATVTITVLPDAVDNSYSTPFQTPLTVAAPGVLGNDIGSSLSVTANTSPSNGSVTQNANGSFTYTPNAGFAGNDSYTYTITDGAGNTDTATVTITVGLPAAPVAVNNSYSTTANTPLTVAAPGVLGNDSGYSITVTSNTNPASGTLTQNANGSLSYTPAAGFSGVVTYTYTITDGFGRTSTATVTITVLPDAVDNSYSTTAGTPLTVAAPGVLGNDIGSGLSVTANTSPSNGSVTQNANGSFTYTPNPGFSGTDSYTYTITDSSGNTDTATVTITVLPDAVDNSYSTPANTTLNVSAPGVLGNDIGSSLTVTSNTNPASGSLTQNADGSLSYVPANGFSGVVTYDYTITDGAGNTDTATVTITVLPQAIDDLYDTPANTSLLVPAPGILGNDLGSGLSVTANTSTTRGTLSQNADGSFTYTPFFNFTGLDSYSYTITDSSGNTSTATVSIIVDTIAGLIPNDRMYNVGIGGTTPNPTPTSPTPGTYDQIVVAGALRLEQQQLVLRLRDGFVPAVGDTFDVMTAGSLSGAFPVIYGQVMPNGTAFDVQYLTDRVRLTVVPALLVTSTADLVDANVGDGVCLAADGTCTLRAAVQEANAAPGRQAIVLSTRVYPLTIPGIGEDAAATGDLDLTGPTTLIGQGSSITGGGIDRIIEVLPGGAISAQQLTVTNGASTVGAGGVEITGGDTVFTDVVITNSTGGTGGGLRITGGLFLMNRGRIAGNSATDGGGAAISAGGWLDGTLVENNTATSRGGGVFVPTGAFALFDNGVIRNNSAVDGGGIALADLTGFAIGRSVVQGNVASNRGGGFFVDGGFLGLTRTRLRQNSAAEGGAGYTRTGTALWQTTTADGNSATVRGGGFVNEATTTLEVSTLSGNSAPTGAAAVQLAGTTTLTSATVSRHSAGNAAASALLGTGGALSITNSVVADQTVGVSCSLSGVALTSGGYNHSSDATCGLTGTGDVQTGTAGLGNLANNGGYTPTHLPSKVSVLVNTGPTTCGALDQRGRTRPIGPRCDKGAVER